MMLHKSFVVLTALFIVPGCFADAPPPTNAPPPTAPVTPPPLPGGSAVSPDAPPSQPVAAAETVETAATPAAPKSANAVRVSLEDYIKEHSKDATLAVWHDKQIEVAGRIDNIVRAQEGNVMVWLYHDEGWLSLGFIPSNTDSDPFSRWAKHQRVKLRGEFTNARWNSGWTWNIVDAGENPAPLLSAKTVAEAYEADKEAFYMDYGDYQFFVRGQILKIDSEGSSTKIMLRGTETQSIEIYCEIDVLDQVNSLKVGDTTTFIGKCGNKHSGILQCLECTPITTPFPVPGVKYATRMPDRRAILASAAEEMRAEMPVAKFAATELAEAIDETDSPTLQMYKHKVLEVTGVVAEFDSDEKYDQIRLETKVEGKSLPKWECQLAESDPWNRLLPGQQVTVKGTLINDGGRKVLRDTVVVEAGPPTEMPLSKTASEIATSFLADRDAYASDVRDKWLIIQGAIAEIDRKNHTVVLKGTDKVKVRCQFADRSSLHWHRFAKHQIGDTVRLLGRNASPDEDAVSIWSVRELTHPEAKP